MEFWRRCERAAMVAVGRGKTPKIDLILERGRCVPRGKTVSEDIGR